MGEGRYLGTSKDVSKGLLNSKVEEGLQDYLALARLGYIPNWGLGFTLLGVGGLMGPLAIWRMKKRV